MAKTSQLGTEFSLLGVSQVFGLATEDVPIPPQDAEIYCCPQQWSIPVGSIWHKYPRVDNSTATVKNTYSTLEFTDEIDISTSIWTREINESLELVQDFSDFFNEIIVSSITFTEDVLSPKDVNKSLQSTLSLINNHTIAGGRQFTIGPQAAVFDSDTKQGQVLYVSSSGHVDLAQANDVATSKAVGISNENVSTSFAGTYFTEGQIFLSDWSEVAGSSLLVPGSRYYLDPTSPGNITVSPPIAAGQLVVIVGTALDANTLDIEIANPILLTTV